MKNNFFRHERITCVILCAGKGTRLLPVTLDAQKTMVGIKQKPLLGFVIDYWKRYVDDFVFVVGYKKEEVYDYVKGLPINSRFVEQKELNGIAHALSLTKDFCSDNFIFVLGDCICKGDFKFPDNFSQGVGVWSTSVEDDIKRSYSVEIKNGLISNVVEKPQVLINDLCGMGFYFFNKVVFDFIKKTLPSKKTGRVEITDVLQTMIDAGLELFPILFDGEYLNVTYPEDLKRAESLLFCE